MKQPFRRLPNLTDRVVRLRPFQIDDAPVIIAAARERDIYYSTGTTLPQTLGGALSWIDDTRKAWRDGPDARLAIADYATGEVLGAIALLGVDRAGSYGRFRYWVRGARRRHGAARRALVLLSAWARYELGLERLEAMVAYENVAAQEVAVAAGFRPEAVLRSYRRQHDHRTDYCLYALPTPSWDHGSGVRDGIDDAEVYPEPLRPVGDEPVLPDVLPVLEGGGLRLRPYRPDDLDALVASIDQEAARWMRSAPWPYDAARGAAFLESATQAWADRRAQFAITEAGIDELIGELNVDIDLPNGIGEVGYSVAPGSRGRGVATQAIALVVDWGLDRLRLARLDLSIDTRNLASLRVAAKSGFRREGTLHGYLRSTGERSDDALASLLPTDPRPAQARRADAPPV
ncbi:MAG TPA: GNAT family protein, partial [Thermoleophilia bacterium]|nr:GNAT family protein [Thermoleophilia bacterium]